jgi:hypothetical protein
MQVNDASASVGLAVFSTLEWLDISDNPKLTGMLPELLAGERPKQWSCDYNSRIFKCPRMMATVSYIPCKHDFR